MCKFSVAPERLSKLMVVSVCVSDWGTNFQVLPRDLGVMHLNKMSHQRQVQVPLQTVPAVR